jgi:hypothetical protein
MNFWAGVIVALALAAVGYALALVAVVRWLRAIFDSRQLIAPSCCGGIILIGTDEEGHRFKKARSFSYPMRDRVAAIAGRSRRADHTSAAVHPLRSLPLWRRHKQHSTK